MPCDESPLRAHGEPTAAQAPSGANEGQAPADGAVDVRTPAVGVREDASVPRIIPRAYGEAAATPDGLRVEASPMTPCGVVVTNVDCPWRPLHGEHGLEFICITGSGTTRTPRGKAVAGSMTDGLDGDAMHVGVQFPIGTICTIPGSTNAAAGSISLPLGEAAAALKLML